MILSTGNLLRNELNCESLTFLPINFLFLFIYLIFIHKSVKLPDQSEDTISAWRTLQSSFQNCLFDKETFALLSGYAWFQS